MRTGTRSWARRVRTSPADYVLAIETTLTSNDTYYVAVAQDQACAALTGYELRATGTLEPKWTSAWTNPDDMPSETQQEKNANALLSDGFSDEVAERAAPALSYQAFTKWAGVGTGTDEINPNALTNRPNVVLASAYNMYETPTGAVAIVECAVTTNAAGTVALRLTLKVTGALTTTARFS